MEDRQVGIPQWGGGDAETLSGKGDGEEPVWLKCSGVQLWGR